MNQLLDSIRQFDEVYPGYETTITIDVPSDKKGMVILKVRKYIKKIAGSLSTTQTLDFTVQSQESATRLKQSIQIYYFLKSTSWKLISIAQDYFNDKPQKGDPS